MRGQINIYFEFSEALESEDRDSKLIPNALLIIS
jgi:hypothetical protein